MRQSMWTYAWDIQEQSPDRVVGELRDAGLNTISLATSYHAGRFLQPRSPARKTVLPEDGTIYFTPTPSRWADQRLQPKVARLVAEGGDVLADLIKRRDVAGMAVGCWTVCLHNSRLGLLHPDATTINAFGQSSTFNLCPSNPDARAYVTTLVADLSATYRPDMIELESPGFMGWAHGHHHEKDGVGLLPEDDLLLSLCFCPSCVTRAAKAGIDGGAARSAARACLEAAFARPVPEAQFPDMPSAGPAAFAAQPALHEFLLWRTEPVTSLIAGIRDRADPASKIVVINLEHGWRDGTDLAAAAAACDGAILCAYDMEPYAVGALLRHGRAQVGPDRYLGTGFRLFYPEMADADAIVRRTEAARAAGIDGVNFYNYGLVPAARLDWVKDALH